MKTTLGIAAALALVSFAPVQDGSPPKADAGKPPEKKLDPIFDEKAVGSEQIAAALAKAASENRRVLVEWGANW